MRFNNFICNSRVYFFPRRLNPPFCLSRRNYKDYSMESRTLFRIHAALAKLKADLGEEEDTDL